MAVYMFYMLLLLGSLVVSAPTTNQPVLTTTSLKYEPYMSLPISATRGKLYIYLVSATRGKLYIYLYQLLEVSCIFTCISY